MFKNSGVRLLVGFPHNLSLHNLFCSLYICMCVCECIRIASISLYININLFGVNFISFHILLVSTFSTTIYNHNGDSLYLLLTTDDDCMPSITS